MPKSQEFKTFHDAMSRILRADPKAVKAAMEAEKQANAQKRKARKPSASGRASTAKD